MKIDFKRSLDSYQARAGEFRILDVAPLSYLLADGHGDPNTSTAYSEALEALYPVAYALKFSSKTELGRDYVVPPLEALWWAEDMTTFTSARDKSAWDWTAMLMVPDWLGPESVQKAVEAVAAKKAPAGLGRVRFEVLDEGCCVQTLHLGPYEEEAATLAELHERFIPDHGLRMTGKHHEVYLNDPRRNAPEKLRTLLRQPVEPA